MIMLTDNISNNGHNDSSGTWQRREFVTTVAKAMGIAPLLSVPGISMAMNNFHQNSSLTVQQVIDIILASIPGAPFPKQ